MHVVDEGVSRYFLEQLMEKDTVIGSSANAKAIDRIWLAVLVPGNSNRVVRSLKHWRQFKAHELRFFIQHAAPFVTHGFIAPQFHKTICLVSRIAHSCTMDSISAADVVALKKLCRRFMMAFEASFGTAEMKYPIHLISHLWYAVQLYGPLHIVSCYGPEDQIGKVTRKIHG
jgi:hypothetical protein